MVSAEETTHLTLNTLGRDSWARFIRAKTASGCMSMVPRRFRNQVRSRLYRVIRRVPLEALLDRGDSVVTVGTRRTNTVDRLIRSISPKGRLLLVEADPAAYDRLDKHIEHSGCQEVVTLVNKAAFSRKDTLKLLLSNIGEDSKLVGLDTYIDNDYRQDGSYHGEVRVEADSLDAILEETSFPVPDKLRVTVNGAEHEVLQGATRVLSSMRPGSSVFATAHAKKDSTGDTIIEDIRAILEGHGFRVGWTKRGKSTAPHHQEFVTRGPALFAWKR